MQMRFVRVTKEHALYLISLHFAPKSTKLYYHHHHRPFANLLKFISRPFHRLMLWLYCIERSRCLFLYCFKNKAKCQQPLDHETIAHNINRELLPLFSSLSIVIKSNEPTVVCLLTLTCHNNYSCTTTTTARLHAHSQ